jgi:hypothetical protein
MNTNEAPRARDIFLFWEKWLRLPYNAFLVVACVVVAAWLAEPLHPVPLNRALAFYLITRAIAANILFIAGPFADLYVSVLLRRRHPAVTAVIFAGGALISLVFVWISLVWFWSWQYPDFSLWGVD